MKDFMIFRILLNLSRNKQAKASEIAKELNISTRTVYRYVDILSVMGVPVSTKVGRSGGIELIRPFYIERLMLSEQDIQVLRDRIAEGKIDELLKNVISKLV